MTEKSESEKAVEIVQKPKRRTVLLLDMNLKNHAKRMIKIIHTKPVETNNKQEWDDKLPKVNFNTAIDFIGKQKRMKIVKVPKL